MTDSVQSVFSFEFSVFRNRHETRDTRVSSLESQVSSLKSQVSSLLKTENSKLKMSFAIVIIMSIIFCGLSFSADKEKEYTIGPGDVIQVAVWQYEQFNGTMTVGPDGKITIHLLGDIPVAGLSREEVKKSITEKLSAFVKEGAEVTVSIVQFNSQKISVFGQVTNPRTITFSSVPSLVEVMVQSIPTPDADLTAVRIIPADSSIREPVTVNMLEALQKGDTSKLPRLHPGDTVYVPKKEIRDDSRIVPTGERTTVTSPQPSERTGVQREQFVIHVMGAVARPGSFVSTAELTLTQALSQAGSVLESALLKDVRVIRAETREGDRVVHVNLEKYLAEGDAALVPKLYSGDTIYVPSITQEGMNETSIMITGEVLRPGSYRASGPLDILDAISLAGGLTPNADPERVRVRRENADSYQEKIVNVDEILESPSEMVEPGYRIYVPARRGSAAIVTTVTRSIVGFLADLVPIYGLWRLSR